MREVVGVRNLDARQIGSARRCQRIQCTEPRRSNNRARPDDAFAGFLLALRNNRVHLIAVIGCATAFGGLAHEGSHPHKRRPRRDGSSTPGHDLCRKRQSTWDLRRQWGQAWSTPPSRRGNNLHLVQEDQNLWAVLLKHAHRIVPNELVDATGYCMQSRLPS